MSHRLDTRKAYVELRSNTNVKFKKVRKRTYELYLESPLSRCSKIWEMLKTRSATCDNKGEVYNVNQTNV